MRAIVHGIWGGLLGGLVFAIIMIVNGTLLRMGLLTLPLIGELVGTRSAAVGFVVHMFNSALIGAVYGPLLGRLGKGMLYGLHVGLLYGAVWWFLGPLTLMPMLLGMDIGSQWSIANALRMFPSLIGHLVYGAILGMVVGGLGPGTSLALPKEAEAAPARDRTHRKEDVPGSADAGSEEEPESIWDEDEDEEPAKERQPSGIFFRRRTRGTDAKSG